MENLNNSDDIEVTPPPVKTPPKRKQPYKTRRRRTPTQGDSIKRSNATAKIQNSLTHPSQLFEEDAAERAKRPRGPAKTLFVPDYTHLARIMCEQGFTTHALARAFKVSVDTIVQWGRSQPEFRDAVREGTDKFNMMCAEKALVKRVTGYDYMEETYESKPTVLKVKNEETGRMEEEMGIKMLLTKQVKKHVAPSEKAIEYYLNNMARFHPTKDGVARWSNKLEVVGAGGKDLIPDNFSPEKLLAELIIQQKQIDHNVVDAEIIEAKQLGVEVGEEDHEDPPEMADQPLEE